MKEDRKADIVDIITPIYNGERYVPDLIQSVSTQTYPSIRHWIWDDGSTDKTAFLLKHFCHSRTITYGSTKNLGAYNTVALLMQAVECAEPTGKFFTFMSVDDPFYNERSIEVCVDWFKANPEMDILVTAFNVKTPDGMMVYPNTLPQFQRLLTADFGNMHTELLRGNFIPSSVFLNMDRIKLSDLKTDATLPHLADWALWLDLSRTFKWGFLPIVTRIISWDGNNYSAPRADNEQAKRDEMLRIWMGCYEKGDRW